MIISLKCSYHDIADKFAHLALNNDPSLTQSSWPVIGRLFMHYGGRQTTQHPFSVCFPYLHTCKLYVRN